MKNQQVATDLSSDFRPLVRSIIFKVLTTIISAGAVAILGWLYNNVTNPEVTIFQSITTLDSSVYVSEKNQVITHESFIVLYNFSGQDIKNKEFSVRIDNAYEMPFMQVYNGSSVDIKKGEGSNYLVKINYLQNNAIVTIGARNFNEISIYVYDAVPISDKFLIKKLNSKDVSEAVSGTKNFIFWTVIFGLILSLFFTVSGLFKIRSVRNTV
jgi:hypothetical protein